MGATSIHGNLRRCLYDDIRGKAKFQIALPGKGERGQQHAERHQGQRQDAAGQATARMRAACGAQCGDLGLQLIDAGVAGMVVGHRPLLGYAIVRRGCHRERTSGSPRCPAAVRGRTLHANPRRRSFISPQEFAEAGRGELGTIRVKRHGRRITIALEELDAWWARLAEKAATWTHPGSTRG